MNTTKTISRTPASKSAKYVVNVALVFAMSGKSVNFAAQIECKGKSKVITGCATEKAMTTALKAVTAELKSKDVHLNVRHNHRNFQAYYYRTQGVAERLCHMLGMTVACNVIKADDARLESLRTSARATTKLVVTNINDLLSVVDQEPMGEYIDADGILCAVA
jgi:hypothetical protein